MTVVWPTGKLLPGGTPVLVIVTPGQLSEAVAVPSVASLTNAEHDVAPGPVFTVTLAGAVIVGFCVSLTITLKLQDASEPKPFEAVHVTDVVPTGKVCGEVIVVAPTLQVTVGVGKPVAEVVKATDAEH